MYDKTNLSERAQALTLEGVVSAMLLVSVALLFSLQITAITPLSASTSSQHIENQQAELAQGMLETTDREELLQTVLYWNNSSGRFHGADSDGRYRVIPPNTELGNAISAKLLDKGIGVNIDLLYYNNNSTYAPERDSFFTTGAPSNHAFYVEKTVPIYEDDVIYDASGNPTSTTVTEADLYVENINQDTKLYNLVTIRITIWRI